MNYIKEVFKSLLDRFLKSIQWSEWKDINTYYDSVNYSWFLVQMKENESGKKVFRTQKITGGSWRYADGLQVSISDLSSKRKYIKREKEKDSNQLQLLTNDN